MNQKHPNKIGRMMTTGSWILLLVLLTILFGNYLEDLYNPNRQVTGVEEEGERRIELQRNRYGHYVATGQINGMDSIFLLDTGATNISIPEPIANTLNLKRGVAGRARTANGTITVYTTHLQEVRLGNIVLYDVPAHINPNMHGNEILLGMSFLKKLDFTQQGKTLTITQPYY